MNNTSTTLTTHSLALSNRTTPTAKPPKSSLTKEASVASALSKTLRESLTPEMSNLCESYLSTKLTGKLRSLAKHSDGKSGMRSFELTKYGKNLNGFNFNSEAPFKKTFLAKYHVQPGSRRGQVILHFPSFIPSKDLRAPNEATNFKICGRLVALSDYNYDASDRSFHPVRNEFNGRYASFDSGMLPLLKMPVDPITTQLSIDQKELPEGTSMFLLLSVSFYQYENGRFKHISKDSALHVESVL